MLLRDILTDTLRNNLEIIKNSCQGVHKDRFLISFTKHDYEHSERMIDLITSLMAGSLLIKGDNQLNEYEVFILLSSIYLHDIGIQINKDEVLKSFAKTKNTLYDSNWPEEKKKEFIRNNHHLLSGYWIKDSMSDNSILPKVYIGDRELGDLISRVVVSHGIDFSIKAAYTQIVEYEGKEIRMKLLCELLNLADSLDCDKRRIDYEKLKINETPDKSMLHWMKHYYCNSVSLKDGQVRIAFQFPKNLDIAQQTVYSTYFKYHTEYWIKYCQEKYKKDLINYHINFTIVETEDYGEKDALSEPLYLAIEDNVVDIVLQAEPFMSPKSVAIGILEYNGKVVLVQRKHEEGCLKWQFPAGFIKEGQSVEERVVEEFENETGIKTRCIKRIGRRIHPDTKVVSMYCALEYVSGSINNIDKKENSACDWVGLDEYQRVITSNIYGGVKIYLDAKKASELEEIMDKKVVVGVVTLGDKILLVKRKPGEGTLLWQFPGGSIENGETAEDAIVRELREETGANVRVLEVIGNRVHPYTKKHMTYIACKYLDGDLEVHDDDLEKAGWIKITDLDAYFTTPLYEKVGDYLSNYLNKL